MQGKCSIRSAVPAVPIQIRLEGNANTLDANVQTEKIHASTLHLPPNHNPDNNNCKSLLISVPIPLDCFETRGYERST